jgi:diaminohydroxyphosphoribosylaminopyrimidine deaminase/5-amino-6-(5-phosphoribosylamino)uracil reductase
MSIDSGHAQIHGKEAAASSDVADAGYMARALQLAERGLYTTDPNPRVGCVIVNQGRVVGEGWHERAGEAHAEINALKAAGNQARGATAYVTLEPCCHHGRTPPCTDALIRAGVARVVAAMPDPNPRVAGEGFAALRQAGIQAEAGLMQSLAEALNPGFTSRMRRGRPYVRAKLAVSLDGRTALSGGESKWITGEAARADVQRLRARSSAILTGIGTVLADDPSLTVRSLDIGRQPLRVVVDNNLSMKPGAKMFGLAGATLIATAQNDADYADTLVRAGAEIIYLPGQHGSVDLTALMEHLAAREVNELMIEAGATLCGALLTAQLIDELVIYYAPHILGSNARGMFNIPGLEDMQRRIALDVCDTRAVGNDWRVTARVVY